jgi:hypothetical protein
VLTVSESERVEAFKSATCAKLNGVRCPVHNQPPRVRFLGKELREMVVNLSACCDRLITIANRAIAS